MLQHVVRTLVAVLSNVCITKMHALTAISKMVLYNSRRNPDRFQQCHSPVCSLVTDDQW